MGGGYQELSWPRAMMSVFKELANKEEQGEKWVKENFYDKIEATKEVSSAVHKKD